MSEIVAEIFVFSNRCCDIPETGENDWEWRGALGGEGAWKGPVIASVPRDLGWGRDYTIRPSERKKSAV